MQEENDLTYHRLRKARLKIKRASALLANISKRNKMLSHGNDLNRYILACELRIVFLMLREARIRVGRMKFLFKKQPDTSTEPPQSEHEA